MMKADERVQNARHRPIIAALLYSLHVLAADKEIAQSEYEGSMTQPDLLSLRRKALQGFRLN